MANCGLHSGVFDTAIDGMLDMGQVEKVTYSEEREEWEYALADPNPRMMQVFPTLEGEL